MQVHQLHHHQLQQPLRPTPPQPPVSEESLRALLGEQLAAAAQRIMEQQEALLEELAGQPQVGWGLGCTLRLAAACGPGTSWLVVD